MQAVPEPQDEDRRVKQLFSNMFRRADEKLARKLTRKGQPRKARKIRQIARERAAK